MNRHHKFTVHSFSNKELGILINTRLKLGEINYQAIVQWTKGETAEEMLLLDYQTQGLIYSFHCASLSIIFIVCRKGYKAQIAFF